MDEMNENELQAALLGSAQALINATVPGLTDEQTAAIAELVIEAFGRGFDDGMNTAIGALFEGAIIAHDARQSAGQ